MQSCRRGRRRRHCQYGLRPCLPAQDGFGNTSHGYAQSLRNGSRHSARVNAAAEVIARGRTTFVDVGQVNGRVFVNNSSIGLYPTLVTEREKYMQRGFSKPIAAILASLVALWRFPNTSVRVTTDNKAVATRTPLVLVGNNRYEFTGLQSGKRANLNDGLLQVSMMNQASRTALIKAALLAIGKVDAEPDMLILEHMCAKVVHSVAASRWLSTAKWFGCTLLLNTRYVLRPFE